MIGLDAGAFAIGLVLFGSLAAGFVTGFAGFGTGLVASGFWYHVLPAPAVPPMVAICSVAGQVAGMTAVRPMFDWPRVRPYLIGGVLGVPLGVTALRHTSPDDLRVAAGIFLCAYSAFQLLGGDRLRIRPRRNRTEDGAVGLGGGFLGGFAGLSGPPPLIWLQLQGGPSGERRAIYQPFNTVVLAASSVAMALAGQVTVYSLKMTALCLPLTLVGAYVGSHVYKGVSEQSFNRVVLILLLVSGLMLVAPLALG